MFSSPLSSALISVLSIWTTTTATTPDTIPSLRIPPTRLRLRTTSPSKLHTAPPHRRFNQATARSPFPGALRPSEELAKAQMVIQNIGNKKMDMDLGHQSAQIQCLPSLKQLQIKCPLAQTPEGLPKNIERINERLDSVRIFCLHCLRLLLTDISDRAFITLRGHSEIIFEHFPPVAMQHIVDVLRAWPSGIYEEDAGEEEEDTDFMWIVKLNGKPWRADGPNLKECISLPVANIEPTLKQLYLARATLSCSFSSFSIRVATCSRL